MKLRFIRIICLIVGLFLISMFILIGTNRTKNPATFTEDCALVLGCKIKGEKILPTLKFRLDKCLEYIQKNPDALIIVSGGKGRGELVAESVAMKRYLISKGISADKIIEENQSKNTRQNMQFSKTLLDARFPSRNYSVVCITTDYHSYRADKLSAKVNLAVSQYDAKNPWYSYPIAYCRESLSIIKMWMGL